MVLSEIVVSVGAPVAAGALGWWVRWTVKHAVNHAVNGQVSRVEEKVDTLCAWTERHDRDHSALVDAMNRQGLETPDGWKERRSGHQGRAGGTGG